MADPISNSSALYTQIVENSIFTPRQLSIILNQMKGRGKPEGVSSGAYYRQLKQCRKKVYSLLFSMVLLQSTGIVKSEALVALDRLAEQLSVIFSVDSGSDVALGNKKEDVMYVINEVIKRISMV
jgi:nanoRNase/pAp phosphatase (c-di-AMP/oligoRNAs hydrolase)